MVSKYHPTVFVKPILGNMAILNQGLWHFRILFLRSQTIKNNQIFQRILYVF